MKKTITLRLLMLAFAAAFLSVPSCVEKTADSTTPLDKLKEGNERFYTGRMIHRNQDMKTVDKLTEGQAPFAVIISCSDSRVTPEIIFDQGLGDIFCVRTAGNVIGDYEEGSVEYAVEHLNTGLVVVLGHSSCGAVKAFVGYKQEKCCDHHHHDDDHLGHIKSILEKLDSEDGTNALHLDGDVYDNVTRANIISGVKQLRQSTPILSELYKKGEVEIIGAIYHIDSGKVEFLDF